MNSTQHPAGGRPMTKQRRQVQALEERHDSHYSFLQGTQTSLVLNHCSEWFTLIKLGPFIVLVFSKERICSPNKDGKYNSIQKWIW
jgi:hypothetical protein